MDRGYRRGGGGGYGGGGRRGGGGGWRGGGRRDREWDDRRDNRGGPSVDRFGRMIPQKESREPREPEFDQDARDIADLVIRIGDDQTPLERNIQGLAHALIADMGKYRGHIVDTIFKCVSSLAQKTNIYGTLVGLMAAEQADIAEEFVKRANADLLVAFRKKDHYAIKYLVRFITELYNANVVSEQSIRSLFRALVSVIGVGAPDIHQHIGDFLACTVMSALPLAGLPVADDESILSSLAHYMKKRTQLPLHVLKDQYGNQSDDWLERLYKSMLGHAKRKWPRLASVYSLHTNMDVRTKLEKLDSSAVDSVVFLAPDVENDDSLRELLLGGHTVSDPSTIDLKEHNVISGLKKETEVVNQLLVEGDSKVCTFTSPRSILRIFPSDITLGETDDIDTDSDSPQLTRLERWYLEDNIIDILHFFAASHQHTVEQLQRLPFNHPNFDDFLLEVLLGELLRLPTSPLPYVHYAVTISDLCIARIQTFPPAMAEAVSRLFIQVEDLDPRCFVTLIDWFATHLSNFDFKWPWQQWAELIGGREHELNRSTQFIKETLHRCIRLSYYERIEKTVPPNFVDLGLLPPKPDVNNPFPGQDTSVPDTSRPQLLRPTESQIFQHPASDALFQAIKGRAAPEELEELIMKVLKGTAVADQGSSLTRCEVLHIVVRGILFVGAKSVTHLQAALDRYGDVVYNLAYTKNPDTHSFLHTLEPAETSVCDESAFEIMRAVWLNFYNSSQHLLIAAFKVMHTNLVAPRDVIRFLFSGDLLQKHGHAVYFWELMDQTIRLVLETAKLAMLSFINLDSNAPEQEVNAVRDHLNFSRGRLRDLVGTVLDCFAEVFKRHSSGRKVTSAYWFDMTSGQFASFGRKYYMFMKESVHRAEASFKGTDAKTENIYRETAFLASHF